MEEFYGIYPKRPIGGTNPYYCCLFCGISAPQINGQLEGHAKECLWRKETEAKINHKNNLMSHLLFIENEIDRVKFYAVPHTHPLIDSLRAVSGFVVNSTKNPEEGSPLAKHLAAIYEALYYFEPRPAIITPESLENFRIDKSELPNLKVDGVSIFTFLP